MAKGRIIKGEDVAKQDLREIGYEIGARLKRLRTSKGFTEQQLETLAQIGKVVCLIEQGKKMLTINEAKSLAAALDTTPEYLIAGEKS